MRERIEDARVGIAVRRVDPGLSGTRKRRCFQSGLASTMSSSLTKVRCCLIVYLSLMEGRWIRHVHLIHFTYSLISISVPPGLATAVSY